MSERACRGQLHSVQETGPLSPRPGGFRSDSSQSEHIVWGAVGPHSHSSEPRAFPLVVRIPHISDRPFFPPVSCLTLCPHTCSLPLTTSPPQCLPFVFDHTAVSPRATSPLRSARNVLVHPEPVTTLAA